jgi:hypothetical protein
MPDACVVIVSSVVTPSDTRAGTASCNDNQNQLKIGDKRDLIEPEGNPTDDDQHSRRQVQLNEIVAEML